MSYWKNYHFLSFIFINQLNYRRFKSFKGIPMLKKNYMLNIHNIQQYHYKYLFNILHFNIPI